MPTIEMNSVVSPNINFDGNDTRKSISVKRDVRIDKIINIEEEEEISAIASDMKNAINHSEALLPPVLLVFKKIGVPVS